MAASFTCIRDVVALLLLLAILLLAAAIQPASATSYQHPKRHPLKATVKNYHKHMTSWINGVEVPPRCSRTVDVSPNHLKVVVKGRQVSCYLVPVPRKYLESKIWFVLELQDCNECIGCGCRSCRKGCPAGALCLKGSIDGKTKFQKCPIIVNLPTPAPLRWCLRWCLPWRRLRWASLQWCPPLQYLRWCYLRWALPPVAIPPILDPLAPILTPIVSPIVNPLAPNMAPIVNSIGPIAGPILGPIVAPILNPILPQVLPPVLSPILPVL